MKKFFSIPRIMGYVAFIFFILLGWYDWDMFNVYGGVELIYIRRNILFILGFIFLVISLFRLFKYNHRGYILHSLGLTFLALGIKIPGLLRTISNRFHIAQLLYIGIIIIIVLQCSVIIQSMKKNRQFILSYSFILFQIYFIYSSDNALGEYISLGGLSFFFFWLGLNILILTIITPNDKL